MVRYKELKKLWEKLSYYIYMGYWPKANNICNRIDELKKGHKIANFFAWLFHKR